MRPNSSIAWSMLMARAQDGDTIAYRRLLEEITPYLRSLVARHRALAGEAEDTVQDVLLTLHTVRHTYDPSRPFGPWLLAIARRRIIDRLRRRNRTTAAEIALGSQHETIAASGPNLYTLLSGGRGLREAIERLPAAWLLVPAPAVGLWGATIAYGCLTDWVGIGPEGVRLGVTLECFLTLLITSIPLSVLLIVMLRHAARLYPTTVAMMGGLASAGIAATALSLFHELNASVMVLLWNLGIAALLVSVGGVFGRRLFASTLSRPTER